MSAAIETTKGKALIIRTVNADMTSHGGFLWPKSGPVECPDWMPTAKCGNGLHGLIWGVGNWALLSNAPDAIWIVAEIDEWIDIDGKVKFPRCDVIYCGDMTEALVRVLCNSSSPVSDRASGYSSTAASSGNYSKAASSGNYSKAASSGDNTIAMAAGLNCIVKSGENGCFSTVWFDGTRNRIAVGYVGENGIKPNTPYRLNSSGEFVDVTHD